MSPTQRRVRRPQAEQRRVFQHPCTSPHTCSSAYPAPHHCNNVSGQCASLFCACCARRQWASSLLQEKCCDGLCGWGALRIGAQQTRRRSDGGLLLSYARLSRSRLNVVAKYSLARCPTSVVRLTRLVTLMTIARRRLVAVATRVSSRLGHMPALRAVGGFCTIRRPHADAYQCVSRPRVCLLARARTPSPWQ